MNYIYILTHTPILTYTHVNIHIYIKNNGKVKITKEECISNVYLITVNGILKPKRSNILADLQAKYVFSFC